MNQGWAKLHRQMKDNPRYKDSPWVHIWVHLLLTATHKPQRMIFDGRDIELQPGQLITSRKSIASDTGINESKVERVLKILKTEQQIEQVSSAISRLITILNWAEYQGGEQVSEPRVNTERTASEQQVNTNKNDKKDKNEEEGEGPRAKNGCSLSAAIKHFEQARKLDPGCTYTDQEVRQAWLDLQATIDEHGYWAFGKKRIGDYRAGLASRIEDNRDRKAKWKTHGNNSQNNRKSSNRNAGTANEGKASQYRGVGKGPALGLPHSDAK